MSGGNDVNIYILFRQVALASFYAHSHAIVHCRHCSLTSPPPLLPQVADALTAGTSTGGGFTSRGGAHALPKHALALVRYHAPHDSTAAHRQLVGLGQQQHALLAVGSAAGGATAPSTLSMNKKIIGGGGGGTAVSPPPTPVMVLQQRTSISGVAQAGHAAAGESQQTSGPEHTEHTALQLVGTTTSPSSTSTVAPTIGADALPAADVLELPPAHTFAALHGGTNSAAAPSTPAVGHSSAIRDRSSTSFAGGVGGGGGGSGGLFTSLMGRLGGGPKRLSSVLLGSPLVHPLGVVVGNSLTGARRITRALFVVQCPWGGLDHHLLDLAARMHVRRDIHVLLLVHPPPPSAASAAQQQQTAAAALPFFYRAGPSSATNSTRLPGAAGSPASSMESSAGGTSSISAEEAAATAAAQAGAERRVIAAVWGEAAAATAVAEAQDAPPAPISSITGVKEGVNEDAEEQDVPPAPSPLHAAAVPTSPLHPRLLHHPDLTSRPVAEGPVAVLQLLHSAALAGRPFQLLVATNVSAQAAAAAAYGRLASIQAAGVFDPSEAVGGGVRSARSSRRLAPPSPGLSGRPVSAPNAVALGEGGPTPSRRHGSLGEPAPSPLQQQRQALALSSPVSGGGSSDGVGAGVTGGSATPLDVTATSLTSPLQSALSPVGAMLMTAAASGSDPATASSGSSTGVGGAGRGGVDSTEGASANGDGVAPPTSSPSVPSSPSSTATATASAVGGAAIPLSAARPSTWSRPRTATAAGAATTSTASPPLGLSLMRGFSVGGMGQGGGSTAGSGGTPASTYGSSGGSSTTPHGGVGGGGGPLGHLVGPLLHLLPPELWTLVIQPSEGGAGGDGGGDDSGMSVSTAAPGVAGEDGDEAAGDGFFEPQQHQSTYSQAGGVVGGSILMRRGVGAPSRRPTGDASTAASMAVDADPEAGSGGRLTHPQPNHPPHTTKKARVWWPLNVFTSSSGGGTPKPGTPRPGTGGGEGSDSGGVSSARGAERAT